MTISAKNKFYINDYESIELQHDSESAYIHIQFCEPQIRPGKEAVLSELSHKYCVDEILDIICCHKYICMDPGRLSINRYDLISYDTILFYQNKRYEFMASTGSSSLYDFLYHRTSKNQSNMENVCSCFLTDLQIPVASFSEADQSFTVAETNVPLVHIAEANSKLKRLKSLSQPDCVINPASVQLYKLISSQTHLS